MKRFHQHQSFLAQDRLFAEAGAVASSLKLDKIATTSFSSCSVNSPLGEFAIKEISTAIPERECRETDNDAFLLFPHFTLWQEGIPHRPIFRFLVRSVTEHIILANGF